MKTLVAVVLGCVLISSQAHAQPAASAGSSTEQFILKSDGTLVPVTGTGGATTAAQSGTTGAAPQSTPRTATPIAAPQASSPSTPAKPSRPISAAPVASSGTIADPESTSAAQAVAAARQALNNKQFAQLSSFVPKARGDILAIYPEYWTVRTRVWSYNAVGAREEIESFLEKHKGAYLADRLRTDWILMAARQGDFGTVRALGAVRQGSSNVSCAQLEASHMTGRRATVLEATKVFAPAPACWKLFDQLVADRVLSNEDLLPYLQDALEDNKTTDARKFAAYIFEPTDLSAYDAMMAGPAKWLSVQTGAVSGMRAEVVAMGLARLARTDLSAAVAAIQGTWSSRLPKKNLQWAYGQIGLWGMMYLDARAIDWYRESGDVRLSVHNEAWRVRAALRQPKIDWVWVIRHIDQMTATQKADSTWVYWKARGLAATGKKNDAQKAYASIATEYSFYGQLAVEELGKSIAVPDRPASVSAQELAQARANPGLRRAVTLFKRGWRTDAVPEWNFTLLGMTDRELLAAAELARQEHIYDRVVVTSGRTKKEVDFTQRFVAPFESRVSEQARAVDVDPAWVYGLIRQESLFIMDARSHVGASGLMQLMPATARWMATKIGMKDFTPGKVNDFDTNTKLGTSYLSMVQSDLGGSQVLASAGYNAGPGRPMLWRSHLSGPVEGAIFAETIPFNETRDYVKKVMSNATYYAALFSGQPQSLKQRLGQIDPQPYARSPLP